MTFSEIRRVSRRGILTAMRVLPVLDVMHGEVVRGIGGRRQKYRRVVSRLTASSRPLDVADALASHFACREFYLADLDALLGGEPAWSMYAALRERGYRLWVDAGVREMTRACQLAEASVESIVVGLETVQGPTALAEIVQRFGERIVFSLDLRHGEPLGDRDAWFRVQRAGSVSDGHATVAYASGSFNYAETIAAQAVRLGVSRLLVLDLARVGLDSGTGTFELCARLCANHPEVQISAGGGVRNRGDLEELRDCGVRLALVASALHDGRLTRADLDGL